MVHCVYGLYKWRKNRAIGHYVSHNRCHTFHDAHVYIVCHGVETFFPRQRHLPRHMCQLSRRETSQDIKD